MKPSYVADYRQKLGLTQQALAEYLKMDRSVLAKVERRTRQLSDRVNRDFLKLVLVYDRVAAQRVPRPVSEAEHAALQQRQQKRLKEVEWQLLVAEQKLTQLVQRCEDAWLQWQAMEEMIGVVSAEELPETERQTKIDWCVSCQKQFMQEIETCNVVHQWELSTKIMLLKTEREHIKRVSE